MVEKKSKGISLHIGINVVDPNHYDGWSGPLQACEYDASDMMALAKQQGFDASQLLTTQATRDAVKKKIKEAATSLEEGDFFFLTYSGHGGTVFDWNQDEDELQDETWCLYDGQLIDDELYALWSEFASGVRILLLSDSCHSGTVARFMAHEPGLADASGNAAVAASSRNAEFRLAPRAMPLAVAARTYRKNREFYDALQKGIPSGKNIVNASVLLISGCQDNQYSMDGAFNGLFTGTLLRVWKKGEFQGDYKKFHSRIVGRMPATQTPNYYKVGVSNKEFEEQRPFTI
jgi:hypothetical protein